MKNFLISAQTCNAAAEIARTNKICKNDYVYIPYESGIREYKLTGRGDVAIENLLGYFSDEEISNLTM